MFKWTDYLGRTRSLSYLAVVSGIPWALPWLCRRKRHTSDTRGPGTAFLIPPSACLCSLVSTPNAFPTPRQLVPNMHNVMSRKSIDIVDQIESERFELAASLDPRSVDFAHRHFPVTHSHGSSNAPEGEKQDHHPPLGVELTGYRLLNLAVVLAFGIPKAISSYHGQAVIPTTLDWVSGTLLAAV